jgi:hypothetical protein
MHFSSLLSAGSLSSLGSFSALDYLATFFLLFILLFVIFLVAPIRLSLNISKKGPLLQGGYRLAWLGLTLGKDEIPPQPIGDLLASLWKEEAEKEVQAKEGRKSKGEEESKEEQKSREEEEGREEERKGDGNEEGERREKGAQMEERSEINKPKDKPKTGIVRTPKIRSLINVAPALANILLDVLKSILFKKISCRLCFGLDDPAQTAIISGYLWSIASVLGPFRPKISIEPWFEGERLEGEFMAEMEVRLLYTVFAVIQALREREIRLLFREMLGLA